jgi:hypothetical protein
MEAMMREISEQKSASTLSPDGSASGSISSAKSSSEDGYVTGTDEPNSSSDSGGVCYSSDDDDDSSSEDMQERIEFIRQKQRLMKRASSVLLGQAQEAYDAATARTASQQVESQDMPGGIWCRAKRVLPKESAAKKALARRAVRPNRGGNRTIQPSPCDPRINLDTVNQVEAEAYDRIAPIEEDENDEVERLPVVSFPQGQWMAQALIRSSSTDVRSNPSDCRWKVIADPVTCSLGLVPPSSFSMEHGISIEDALQLSDEGHLLTQATPPFCVVHVNKAFLVLTGLSSATSLIGIPVEAVLQATQDMTTFPARSSQYEQPQAAEDFVWARFLASGAGGEQDESSYQMKIVPVLDRSQRRRLSSTVEGLTPPKGYTCLSHVLVRVRKVEKELLDMGPATLEEEEFTIMQVSETDTKNYDDTGQSSVSGNSYTLGLIG